MELDQAISEVLRRQPDARIEDVMRVLQAEYRGRYDGTAARLSAQALLADVLADAGVSSGR
ncbi:hypothetical protein [Deinococcus sp. UYEF24]